MVNCSRLSVALENGICIGCLVFTEAACETVLRSQGKLEIAHVKFNAIDYGIGVPLKRSGSIKRYLSPGSLLDMIFLKTRCLCV